MELTVLSNLIEKSVSLVPRLVTAVVIAGVGWIIARWVRLTVKKGLAKEDIPRTALIARFSSAVIILFFSAMAMVELDIAREVVVIGFTVIIITLGLLAVIRTAMGGKGIVKKVLARLDEDECLVVGLSIRPTISALTFPPIHPIFCFYSFLKRSMRC